MKYVLVFSMLMLLVGCKDVGQEPTVVNGFKDVFLERGSDADQSYRSIRTQRQTDASLRVVITKWTVQEMGPILFNSLLKTNPPGLYLEIGARCGTVTTQTPIKVSFSYSMPTDEEKSVNRIEYGVEDNQLVVRK